jgi:putative membrane protein
VTALGEEGRDDALPPDASDPSTSVPGPDRPGRLPWATSVLEGRRYLVAMLGIAFFTGGWSRWPLVALAVVFVARVVQLRLVRWWVGPEAFVIERGLLFRSRRVIPRARVQAVDLERGLLHRMLGLTEVRVEALGGGATEGQLPGLWPSVASALRDELLGEGTRRAGGGPAGSMETPAPGDDLPRDGAAHPVGGKGPPRVRLTGGEVVVAGLTESRLGAGIALVGVSLESIRQGAFSGWFGPLEEWLPVLEALPWVAVLVAFAVFVLLFSLVLSFTITVLGYWDFTLRDREDVLEVERGLLTQHRDTVPRHRIQAVRVEENPFRRLMGLASVRVVVAGRAGGGAAGTNVLLPVGPRREAFALAAEVAGWHPGSDASPIPELAPMPPGARRRRWTRAALASVAAGLVVALVDASGAWIQPLLAGVLVAAVALPMAEGAWRGLGWAHLGEHAAFREGILERRTTLVPLDRLQSVEITSNPFQRRLRLATLTVPVARPVLEADPRALDLDRGVAETIRGRMLANR